MWLDSFFFGKESKVINEEEVRDLGSTSRDGDGCPIQIIYFMIYFLGQKFHAHDEEIEWDGITLSNPSGRLELISFGSIYKNRYGGGRDT